MISNWFSGTDSSWEFVLKKLLNKLLVLYSSVLICESIACKDLLTTFTDMLSRIFTLAMSWKYIVSFIETFLNPKSLVSSDNCLPNLDTWHYFLIPRFITLSWYNCSRYFTTKIVIGSSIVWSIVIFIFVTCNVPEAHELPKASVSWLK